MPIIISIRIGRVGQYAGRGYRQLIVDNYIAILLTKVRKPPARITDAHLGENPLFVGLRRLVSELRTQLTRFACSGTVLRSAAMLAHSRIFKQMLIL